MSLNQKFNKFEIQVYSRILDYWLELSLGCIDFNSKADKNLIKHLGLLESDYPILEKFYQNRLALH